MDLESTICPHCGCHCEDPEYCAACGKLFDDNLTSSHNVSFLEALGRGLQSISSNLRSNLRANGEHESSMDQDSDLDCDASWSTLSSNLYNRHNLK
ncbi:hypothetical protein [Desulfogranum marinum]|uniref:hypothetical protein n=1 Tax=Desulfogranum marinum TaxID=453220 RepID=UPI0019628970|nr:hypothetical protein [Desulfogranum marinum]MBM9514848.1 hypothetical protein [Desulfogranum marinum]